MRLQQAFTVVLREAEDVQLSSVMSKSAIAKSDVHYKPFSRITQT